MDYSSLVLMLLLLTYTGSSSLMHVNGCQDEDDTAVYITYMPIHYVYACSILYIVLMLQGYVNHRSHYLAQTP